MSVRPHPTKSAKEPGQWWYIDYGRSGNRKIEALKGTYEEAKEREAVLRGNLPFTNNGSKTKNPTIPAPLSEGPSIYFIQSGFSGPIKIGYTTTSISKRLRNLQTSNHEVLRLVGYIYLAPLKNKSNRSMQCSKFTKSGASGLSHQKTYVSI